MAATSDAQGRHVDREKVRMTSERRYPRKQLYAASYLAKPHPRRSIFVELHHLQAGTFDNLLTVGRSCL